MQQISEEGAIQVFKQPNLGVETLTVGVVGVLQFEVLEYRMKHEYGVDIVIEPLPFSVARWVSAKNISNDLLGFFNSAKAVEDKLGRPVILYKDEWTLSRAQENNKDIDFFEFPPIV